MEPKEYDNYEKQGQRALTNRVVEAFSPITFDATGYPTRVSETKELWKFIDVMHETRLDQTVDNLMEGLSENEFQTFAKVVKIISSETEKVFGFKVRCENALLRAFNVYRYIKIFSSKRVLEIGPGCGYLGFLISLNNGNYTGVENTQAFYLVQNLLLKLVNNSNKFLDLAVASDHLFDTFSNFREANCIHVPWWKIVSTDAVRESDIDLVTANHCLAEMHENARLYYIRLAYELLKKNDGIFIFEGWGRNYYYSSWHVCLTFIKTGFNLVYADERIIIFSPNGNYKNLKLPRSLSASHLLRNLFRKIAGIDLIPYKYSFKSFKKRNKFSVAIKDFDEKIANTERKFSHDIKKILSTYYGETDSDEEVFLKKIQKIYQ